MTYFEEELQKLRGDIQSAERYLKELRVQERILENIIHRIPNRNDETYNKDLSSAALNVSRSAPSWIQLPWVD